MNSEGWEEIELNYCGKQVKGSYKLSGRLMTVISESEIKIAQARDLAR
jgi:hypothetical protein